MPPVLYPRERRILECITQYINRFGYAPTLNEIAEATDVKSVSTIHEHLKTLEEKGFIKKQVGAYRGIEVIKNKTSIGLNECTVDLPVLGFIAAGEPLEPHTDPNLYFHVAPTMISANKPAYILQVKGNSLIEDGILDGDYVVVQHQQEAKNGQLVVAILRNGLATLKRIYFEKNRIKLMPANSSMAPIYATDVKIQGVVKGVIRRYQNL